MNRDAALAASLIRNERTKLTATAVSNLGLAVIVAGFVAPLISWSFGLATAPAATGLTVAFSVVWMATGLILHVGGRWLLRYLRP